MKEPRFHGNATYQSHKTMSKIKGKDTKPEIALRKALWASGIRYRKNYNMLPGRPDIAITKYKIAIFVDSEFFHGKDWNTKKEKITNGSNGEYWSAKIERNIERDIEKTAALKELGYTVIRFWSRDVLKDPLKCVHIVQEIISQEDEGDINGEKRKSDQ